MMKNSRCKIHGKSAPSCYCRIGKRFHQAWWRKRKCYFNLKQNSRKLFRHSSTFKRILSSVLAFSQNNFDEFFFGKRRKLLHDHCKRLVAYFVIGRLNAMILPANTFTPSPDAPRFLFNFAMTNSPQNKLQIFLKLNSFQRAKYFKFTQHYSLWLGATVQHPH